MTAPPAVHLPGPCAACLLRRSSFCGALLAPAAEPVPPPRQSFGGAKARQAIYVRHEPSEDIYILCYGWAARVVQLQDGRRQILAVLHEGDLFSSRMVFESALDCSVQALTDVRFSRVNRADLQRRLRTDGDVLDALAKVCMAEAQEADALLLDLGRRTAEERVARVVLTLARRHRRRYVVRGQRLPFPLRQHDLADLVGLTPVHVSRVVSQFRRSGLLDWSAGGLEILDEPALQRIGDVR